MSRTASTVRPIMNRSPAFTLVELLVVAVVMSLLMSILVTSLRSVRSQANSLVCKSNLRQIAINFNIVANNPLELKRFNHQPGDSALFGLTSFVDQLYGAGAYYRSNALDENDPGVFHKRGESTYFCPSGPRGLHIQGGARVLDEGPNQSAVLEDQEPNVSYAFNARLHRVSRYNDDTHKWEDLFVGLGPNMLNWPRAPRTALVLDVDAAAAHASPLAKTGPHLVAPPIEPKGLYQPNPSVIKELNYPNGKYWFPSDRHDGKTNVALLDTSVHALENLLAAEGQRINWADAQYQGQWVDGTFNGPVDPPVIYGYFFNRDTFSKLQIH